MPRVAFARSALVRTTGPPRPPRQTGRPRLKGRCLPFLTAVATEPTTAWASVSVGE